MPGAARPQVLAVCNQFRAVLAAAEERGWAHPSILSPRLPLQFDGVRSEYTALVWDDLMAEVWPRARTHWEAHLLPVCGERGGGEGGGSEAPSYLAVAPLSPEDHFWAMSPSRLQRVLMRCSDVDGIVYRQARVRVHTPLATTPCECVCLRVRHVG